MFPSLTLIADKIPLVGDGNAETNSIFHGDLASFISNNFEWAGSSVADIYKARWGVEVFFKQIKQTLQISDFLGHATL